MPKNPRRRQTKKSVLTLSIQCVSGAYFNEPFLRVAEIPSDRTLGDLHFFMLDLTGFDDDHPSTFYAANTLRGRRVWFTETGEYDERHDAMDGPLWDIPLDNIFPLPPHKKLYYWFDFGDDWIFEIRKKGKAQPPQARVKYPRVIHEDGPKPEQYPVYEE